MAPKFASNPLSGAGAARNGGRFNPPGVETLYLSQDLSTALAEYGQDMPDRPGAFCAYAVNVSGILDLTGPKVRKELGISDAVLTCPWQKIALVERETPPSWTLGQRLIDLGYPGMIVNSVQRRGGCNIVLWRWNTGPDNDVRHRDPNKDLPTG